MEQGKGVKYVNFGIGSAFLVALMYVLSTTVRVASGISQVTDRPGHLVRLQVVNGCGEERSVQRVVEHLQDYVAPDLEIKVVDMVDFDLRRVSKSFVVSRDPDKTAARMLAERSNLDPTDVIFKPLEHNHRQVSATQVLGADYGSCTLPATREKEI